MFRRHTNRQNRVLAPLQNRVIKVCIGPNGMVMSVHYENGSKTIKHYSPAELYETIDTNTLIIDGRITNATI